MLQFFYSIFRFSFEILSVLIAGYWGFGLHKIGNFRYIWGIAAPLAVVLIWSIWGAPASPDRLPGVPKLLLELSIYVINGFFLYHTNFRRFSIAFIIIGIINALINFIVG